MTSRQTPSQTVGPFFAMALTPRQYGYEFPAIAGPDLVSADTDGEHIRIEGRVLDGEGAPISDALIEIWQADALGRYAHPADPRGSNASFAGFGRAGTGSDAQSRFVFSTVKPGAVDDVQAPHINVAVFMRGLLSHAYTRLYFSDESDANAADPVLSTVPVERRSTLIAKREETGRTTVYRFDIRMQGEGETVFFDI